MTAEMAGKSSGTKAVVGKKMARLPQGIKVQKRPLLRPHIASPYASQQKQKIVFLSSKTPFIAGFKKIKQLLQHVEEREMQSALTGKGLQDKSERHLKQILKAPARSEPVFVRATGRAIDKALNLALFLQQQDIYRVIIKTGTVNAIDDLVPDRKAKRRLHATKEPQITQTDQRLTAVDDDPDAAESDSRDVQEVAEEAEMPEARLRKTSMLELIVSRR